MSNMYPHTITIYNKQKNPVTRIDEYYRFVLEKVFFNKVKIRQIVGGVSNADENYYVIVPRGSAGDYEDPRDWEALAVKTGKFTLQKGDLIVKGTVTTEITKQSDLITNNDIMLITEVDDRDFGILEHIKVIGK